MSIFLLLCVAILVFVSIRLYILWTRATERLRLVEFVASRQEIDRQREKISDELDALICQKTPVERVEDSHEYESGEPQAEPEPDSDFTDLIKTLEAGGYTVAFTATPPPEPLTAELVEIDGEVLYQDNLEPEPEPEPEPKKPTKKRTKKRSVKK